MQFNIESLRISDLPEGEEANEPDVYNNIMRNSNVKDDNEANNNQNPDVKAQDLRKMIANMNKLNR